MAKRSAHYEYDPEKRRLAKIYSRQKLIMSIGNSIVIPLTAIAVLFLTGVFERLAEYSLNAGGSILGIILFVFFVSAIFLIFEFPLKLYGGYFYEHKYKLSNHTLSAWFNDFFKETLLELVFAVPIGAITAFLLVNFRYWWLYTSIVGIFFSLFINFIYPVVFLPFLYKLKPYKDKSELKKILEILKRVGVTNIKKIKVLIESEKSKKVDAMFAGMGKTKSIILYDNLLDKFTKKEVRTVIAHELGHYVHKDIIKFEIFGAAQSVLLLYLTNLIIRNNFTADEFIPLHIYPVVSGILIVLGFLAMPLMMAYSRKQEAAADKFALDHIKDSSSQISTEKKLCDIDLADDKPNAFIEFWFHSHPCAEKRIKMAEQWAAENNG